MENKIDFVLTWVDDTDMEWRKEKNKYSSKNVDSSNSDVRFRDWDLLKYWFRGVEKYASWVNKIYFVTCGQKPEWLNEKHPKLVFIEHKDYIEKEFLPTFSANPIEINFHKIKELSEKFVYFNDDMYIINKVTPDDFFKNNLPCDTFIEMPLYPYGNGDVFPFFLFNDIELINKYFNKRDAYKKNWKKYINFKYGVKNTIKTFSLLQYSKFSNFAYPHIPSSFLKSTLEEVWNLESNLLNNVSKNKFRNKEDLNQYVFKAWQFCKGDFVPRSYTFGDNIPISNDNQKLIKSLVGKKYKTLCINDSCEVENFDKVKKELQNAFEKKFPEKCSFEK